MTMSVMMTIMTTGFFMCWAALTGTEGRYRGVWVRVVIHCFFRLSGVLWILRERKKGGWLGAQGGHPLPHAPLVSSPQG